MVMEKESMAIFANNVRELSGSVVELARCYTMSWVFLKAYERKDLEEPIRFHQDFVDTTRDSLIQMFFVTTYRLFQDDPKSLSLRKLLNNIRPFDQNFAQNLISKIDSQQLLLNKMFHIRHKIYAHRDGAQRPIEVLRTTRREMKAVVRLACDVISALSDMVVTKMKHALEEHIEIALTDVKKTILRRMKFANYHARKVLKMIKANTR